MNLVKSKRLFLKNKFLQEEYLLLLIWDRCWMTSSQIKLEIQNCVSDSDKVEFIFIFMWLGKDSWILGETTVYLFQAIINPKFNDG